MPFSDHVDLYLDQKLVYKGHGTFIFDTAEIGLDAIDISVEAIGNVNYDDLLITHM